MKTVATLSAHDARQIIDAALGKADELGVAACVAVTDQAGSLIALHRMDGGSFLFPDGAIRKATAAAAFGTITAEFGAAAAKDPVMLASMTAIPNISLVPGGIPIKADDLTIGAVGVVGGLPSQDHTIAQHAASALPHNP